MNRISFIKIISSLSLEELNQYIKDNGKVKEPESYNCPWYIDMDRLKDDKKNNQV